MKRIADFRSLLRRGASRAAILCALTSLPLGTPAAAKPVTYTGFTIADGKLGSWEFHNARVYLSLVGDTQDVQFLDFPNPSDPTIPAHIAMNSTGKAMVTVMSGNRTMRATFAPHQIFVSLDRGDDQNPGSRGVGFGSFAPDGQPEPAYPLAIEDGSIDRDNAGVGNVHQFSQELSDLPTNLVENTGFSGRAWECIGFTKDPSGPTCSTPVTPLKTDKGDFFLFQEYRRMDSDGSVSDTLSGGFFRAVVGREDEGDSLISQHATAAPSPERAESQPVTYTAFLISDVQLGGRRYRGAQVYLSLDAHVGTVVKTGFRSVNSTGSAHVRVVSGRRTILADFAPHQIYVYFDAANAGVGFGSLINGVDHPGYPLTLTSQECDSLTENSLIGAVSDVATNPSNAANYTADVLDLNPDLMHATTLSGPASSCAAFDPVTSTCSDANPISLKTNRGNFYLFRPYTDLDVLCSSAGPISVNWGSFWVESGTRPHEP